MSFKIEVTVRCINNKTSVYSCCANYDLEGNMIIEAKVEDHQKQCILKMAADALDMTHTLVRKQIKTDKETVEVR